ncbi:MAG: sulfatase-like hydrolase/transferase [Myxococcota bacterium]
MTESHSDPASKASSSETPSSEAPPSEASAPVGGPPKKAWNEKRITLLVLKVGFTLLALGYVIRKVASRDGFDEVLSRLGDLHWGWWFAAVGMQLCAIGMATTRWRLLLGGQGIRAGWRFLIGSFFIGRFWGAFTPGGLGLDGWRLYDVASRTKKVARTAAITGVEKILGQLAFGIVVMASSVFGAALIGMEGVIIINLFFVALVSVGLTLLAKPQLFQVVSRVLPKALRLRIQTLVDAVCAYHGKFGLLIKAVLLGVGVHAFNNLIYVCAAQAVGIELSPLIVFFGSSLTIMSTLIPASINGIGLREATSLALYTSAAVGLSEAEAVLIPVVGIAAEYAVSVFGIFPYLLRRGGYRADLVVEDPDRERPIHAALKEEDVNEGIFAWLFGVPAKTFQSFLGAKAEGPLPKRLRWMTIGAGAGLLGGMLVGLAEASVIIVSGGGRVGYRVLSYGAISYALLGAVLGIGAGFALVQTSRILSREGMREATGYARITGGIVAVLALGLGAFRVRRDVFHEELVWKSLEGAAVGLGCLLAAGLLYLGLSSLLGWLLARRPGKLMLKAWGSPALVSVLVACAAAVTLLNGQPAEAAPGRERATPPEDAGNVMVIVIDTLRADHLPGYGYENGSTPHLDAFAEDSIRFDQAFANASWTRPSFASILTGRYASSHGVMSKADQLPDTLVTLPEALADAGYYNVGFVTNYNVAPYFNFQQGFDRYRYLEPEFVLWADDASAKLLFVQFLRQRIERYRAVSGTVLPGTAYRDAETVNQAVFGALDNMPQDPWFMFVGYMDPHDPYFVHPYSGYGYARAAHQEPDIEEAPRLRELYDGEITYWDEHFGTLIEDLKRRGVYDDMTLIVTSDHGEEFADHGGFWHGTTLYDEQVRVPLFVKLPGARRAGTVVRHWVQSIDIMPTLLAEAGIEGPEGLQGGSLFEGTDTVFAEESHESNVLEAVRERRGTDEYKLITANPGNPRGLDTVELYRVDDDPGETENLADSSPDDVHQMTEALIAAEQRAREGAVERQTVELDDDAAQRLEAIGYGERNHDD